MAVASLDLTRVSWCFYSHNGGLFSRDIAECSKKWQDFKHRTLKKYDRTVNPPTGGGSSENLSDLENQVVDFFMDRKSGTIRGVVGGVESAVSVMCTMLFCFD